MMIIPVMPRCAKHRDVSSLVLCPNQVAENIARAHPRDSSSGAYATLCRDADTGEGYQELRPRVLYERYDVPDMGVYIRRLEGRNMRLGPLGPSRTHAAASTAFEAALEGHGRGQ
jgi:hypothetical protein